MTDLLERTAEAILYMDRLVHEPARLAISTVLAACERADFLFLERATGLSRGHLSVQLSRLEEAGLVEIEKTMERKRTLTTSALTRQGRAALEAYWRTMEKLRVRSQEPAEVRPGKAVEDKGIPGILKPSPGQRKQRGARVSPSTQLQASRLATLSTTT